MAKRSIGKCRFYADYPSYLKSLGYYKGTYVDGFKDSVTDNDIESIFNMNPTQPMSLELDYNAGFSQPFNQESFKVGVKFQDDEDEPNVQLAQLLKTTNYAGVLGHNFMKLSDEGISNEIISVHMGFSNTTEDLSEANKIVNFQGVNYSGYSLWETGGFPSEDANDYKSAYLQTNYRSDSVEAVQFNAKISSFTFGRYFEPSHSPDLSVKLIKSYEGVDVQTTVGGSTITNFNHLGQPMWGDLPAWTLEKQKGHDYNVGADRGRRTWKVGFSYLSDTDIFNTATNENKFFTWNDPATHDSNDTGEAGYTIDTSMASFFALTHNGNLRFIFCPDNDADNKEFALCMIDQDSLTYTQVAHRTWNVSMNIMEVW